MQKKINENLILTLYILFVISFLYLVFPNLEFKSPKANRIWEIAFNIFCFYTALLVFTHLKKIQSKIHKYFWGITNGIFLVIMLLTLPISPMKIGQRVQYYDIDTLYWNKKNKFEKVQKQYYINWENNHKNITLNKISDLGPFRNYLEYNIEIEQMDEDWVKAQ
jgi:hypothetical protein